MFRIMLGPAKLLGRAVARSTPTFGGFWRVNVELVLKYIELKSGYSDDGPAWIAKVGVSKSGRTLYFNGKALKRGQGIAGNHVDLETGEEYWVSNVKKDGADRHWAGGGKVSIESSAVLDYLDIIGAAKLNYSTFNIIPDLKRTDPSMFYEVENRHL